MIERLVLALAVVAGCSSGTAEPKPAPGPVKSPVTDATVTYLANMGVLLEVASEKIIIDGLHRFYDDAYAVLPDDQRKLAENARGRFADVDVVIASHKHGDHFSVEAVASHLSANQAAVFFGAPQVAQPARAAVGRDNAGRVREVSLAVGATERVTIGDIKLEFLSLRHTYPQRHDTVQNLGVIVEVAGLVFLHVGDALESADNFASFDLTARRIDVAVIPAWYMLSEEGRRVVRDHVSAGQVLAGHIDPRSSAKTVAELGQVFPPAVPMTLPLQSWHPVKRTTR